MNINLRMIFTAGLAVTALAFGSCKTNCVKGSGNITSEDRQVTNFTKVKISGAYKVIFKQDSSLTVRITGDDNLLEHIKAKVSGDELKISSKKNLCAKDQIKVIVGIKQLSEINGSGAIEFRSEGKLNLGDLELNLTGAGSTDLDINAGRVVTKSSGSSDIKLKGQASSHTVNAAGNADLNAVDFVVSKYDIEAAGAFDAKINVLDELNTKTTGAADIKYRGNPKTVNTSKTGASSVKKME